MDKNEEMDKACNAIGREIESRLPKGQGFALLLFEFASVEGNLTYVSNGCREDMVKVLRKLLFHLEKRCV